MIYRPFKFRNLGLPFVSSTRKFGCLCLVLIVISIALYCVLLLGNNLLAPDLSYISNLDFKGTRNNDKITTTQAIQLNRIAHFKSTCAKYGLYESAMHNGNVTLSVLHSEKYKLASKLIPKVGSTFMIQAFHILTKSKSSDVFKQARSHIHDADAISFRHNIAFDDLKDYTMLISARNPYSRLYSAYIDKIFIFNNFRVCEDVFFKLFRIKNTKSRPSLCRYDISFEQFLKYHFDAGGKMASEHYNPIMSNRKLWNLCILPKIVIIKQESFSDDVDLALKAVKVKGDAYDVLYKSLHTSRGQSAIISIVKTVYEKLSHKINKTCLKWKDIARRLWKSFQIQGYIRNSSGFPEHGKYLRANDLISVIKKELKIKPMTHEESIKQRNKALIKAYANVDAKYLQKIRKYYALDFEAFQYDKSVNV